MKKRMQANLRAEMSFIERPSLAAPDRPNAPPPEPGGDWVRAIFRALSMNVFRADTTVDGEDVGIVIDLTTPGVLEAAAGYLAGVTLYPDHNRSVEAWLGRVTRSWWSMGAAAGPEAELPAGINAEIEVDQVANPKIARGLLAEPPIINACSVGMDFDYEQSHPAMTPDQFIAQQGETVNGAPVRCIVTAVYPFSELSLVWRGADPTAIKLSKQGGGDTLVPDRPGARANLAGTSRSREEDVMKLSAEMGSKVRALLGNRAPTDLEAVEAEDLVASLVAEGEGLSSRLKKGEADLAALRPEAEMGRAMLADLREDVLRTAKLARLGTAEGELDTATRKVIEASSRGDLGAMLAEFQAEAGKRFPMTCQACGSTNVSRRSSLETPPGEATPAAELLSYDPAAERLSEKYREKK